MKKILLGFGTLAIAIAVVPMFAAFEAHVVNVTATIENALSVPLDPIVFGTVFPQEHLNKSLLVSLSNSFLNEDRVDDVEYIIRQKPKCGITSQNGEVLDYSSTATGHVSLGPVDEIIIDCGPAPRDLAQGETWGVLPSLCEYISKEPDENPEPGNDGSLASFHEPFTFVGHQLVWNDVKGHLAKSANDLSDNWTIDLAVPCFGGYCAQDWTDFVHRINPDADPSEYTQPIANEHKVFGCDLWIEVGGISLPGLGCKDQIDLMLVLDRSGSIDSGELTTMKTAAKAFVDGIAPTTSGAHIGQSSFATTGTLDTHLSDDATAIKANIDAIISSGFTNLYDGITLATAELANPGDGHDRDDGDSPDFMVIITDGAPNEPGTEAQAQAAAIAAANAAKADGIEIFVVGVGTTTGTADFLKNNISSGVDHYYDAADFDDLQAVLELLVTCNG